MLLLLSFVKLY